MLLPRCESATVLLYTIHKCLVAYRHAVTSKQLQSFNEGGTFAQRLKALLDNKISAKKFKVFSTAFVPVAEDEGDEVEEVEDEVEQSRRRDPELKELQDCAQVIITHLKHTVPVVRQAALGCLIVLIRSALHVCGTTHDTAVPTLSSERVIAATSLLSDIAVGVITELVNKKHTRYTMTIVSELLNRFPGTFFAEHLIQRLILGTEKGSSTN